MVCPPRRPDLKPYVEHCLKILKYEWLARYSPSTYADGIALLEPFIAYHNDERPHQGQAGRNAIPHKAFSLLPPLPSLPPIVQCNRWLQAEHRRAYRRRISSSGAFRVDSHSYFVGQDHAQQPMLVVMDAPARQPVLFGDKGFIKRLPLIGLYPDELPFVEYLERAKAEARLIERYREQQWEQTGESF